MPVFEEIVDGFRRECAQDYVGLWQISRVLNDFHGGIETEQVLAVVAAPLENSGISIGHFENGCFIEWIGSPEEFIHRLRSELLALGAVSDIGDVAWLVQRV